MVKKNVEKFAQFEGLHSARLSDSVVVSPYSDWRPRCNYNHVTSMPYEKRNYLRDAVDLIRLKIEGREAGALNKWLGDELKHAILNLEPAQSRQHVQQLLVEMRKRFDWNIQPNGASREEERLLGAYDYAVTLPLEKRDARIPAILVNMVDEDRIKQDEISNLSMPERRFLDMLDSAFSRRPEEEKNHSQEFRQKFEQKKQEIEEKIARRQERKQIKHNWQEVQEERKQTRQNNKDKGNTPSGF